MLDQVAWEGMRFVEQLREVEGKGSTDISEAHVELITRAREMSVSMRALTGSLNILESSEKIREERGA